MIRALSSILIAGALAAGCAHTEGDVRFGTDAERNYQLGLQALDSNRYPEAIRYFDHVRYKYPYSTQAALADLAIGDTRMAEDKYAEAVEAYRGFLKLHPNHPKADYAQFQIAKAYYEDIPSDFFIFPPSSEKDQTAVRDARTSLEEFLRLYPRSSYQKEAQQLLEDVQRRLAAHELYVADFYRHRERWQAAVGRLNRLLEQFPGTALEGEALFKLGDSYLKLGDKAKAREALERLLRSLPEDKHRPEAEQLLKSLS